MSRGLGWLQREILATLEDAKRAPWGNKGFNAYVGYGGEWSEQPSKTWRWMRPGWVRYRGACVRLHEGWYDLQASEVYLARKHQRLDYNDRSLSPAWRAAFSRAVAGLVHRQKLIPAKYLIPLYEIDEDSSAAEQVEYLSDGVYLSLRRHSRHLRFVSVNVSELTLRV
jgi:hypothetical protein